MLEAGEIGEIHHFRARYLQDWLADPTAPASWRLDADEAGSGALGDLGAHIIDLARYLVGEIASVGALTRTFVPERPGGKVTVDDAFEAFVEFEGGAVGTLEASRFCLGRKNALTFEINGSQGSLRFELERINELQVDAGGTRLPHRARDRRRTTPSWSTGGRPATSSAGSTPSCTSSITSSTAVAVRRARAPARRGLRGRLPSRGGVRRDHALRGLGRTRDGALPVMSATKGREATVPLAIPRPGKIVCVGLNYRDHAAEGGQDLPKAPLLFAKWPNTLIGHGDPVVLPPESTAGRLRGRARRRHRARRPGACPRATRSTTSRGYICVNDVSARDLQFADGQWTRGKSPDTFCPVGPRLVPREEIDDPQALAIRCIVNGEALQDSSTAQMIFSVAEIIAYTSQVITLEPGDLIATGTPAGVGVFRDPKVLLAGRRRGLRRDRGPRHAHQPDHKES